MNPLQRHQSRAAKAKWRGVTKNERSEMMRDVVMARWDKVRRLREIEAKINHKKP